MVVKRRALSVSGVLATALVAALALSLSGASCGDDDRPTTPPPVTRPAPTFRLVVLTDLKGYLEPCGCTSRPLGGIDRTAAKVKSLRDDGPPVLPVVAGDLFFDGMAHGIAGAEQQEVWRAETLAEILRDSIGVEAAAPGRLDLSHGTRVLADLAERACFPLLAAGVEMSVPEEEGEPTQRALPDRVVREVAGARVGIFGVSDMSGPDGRLPEGIEREQEMLDAARAAVGALREDGAGVIVGLVRGTRRDARAIAREVEGIDFLVQGGLDLEEPIPPFEVDGTWVLHAGRQGQGVVVVDVFLRGDGTFTDWSDWTREEQRAHIEGEIRDLRARIAAWEGDDSVPEADVDRQRARLAEMERELESLATPRAVEGNAFAARYEELPPSAPRAPAVSRAMEAHFRQVNRHNREVFADLAPPELPEGAAGYVGSLACRSCHEIEHDWWAATKHGRAYATLVDRHKEFNLSCVGCHVTGYMDPGGSTVTHLGSEGVLKDVGCESCHGPGSLHSQDPEVGVTLDPPQGVCIECHNPEHSDTFNYTSYRAMMLAPGHGMPHPRDEER